MLGASIPVHRPPTRAGENPKQATQAQAGGGKPASGETGASRLFRDVRISLERLASPVAIVSGEGETNRPVSVTALSGQEFPSDLIALLPSMLPADLGQGGFTAKHGCRRAYVVGEMARGIATVDMVVAAARAGLFGFFGSAGLRPPAIGEAIDRLSDEIGSRWPWGMNLIHSPDQPERERDVATLLLDKGVRKISASAFMQLSPQVVRLSAAGLSRSDDGTVRRDIDIFAKVSRPEVAQAFLVPPPADMLRELTAAGLITQMQAELQSGLPVAEDMTVEADSGGHTDNRPLRVVFPLIDRLRQSVSQTHGYQRPIRLGAAGGLGTPSAVAAAFHLGADYVVTGSVNQAAVESGLSDQGRAMLAAAGIADVTMAPAADMFERGVKVQVLKRGTMFHARALRLYDFYRRREGLHDLSAGERDWLEQQVLSTDCKTAWSDTRAYHAERNPELIAKADGDGKLQMALVFRRYLYFGAQWARDGHEQRRADYQIWCGPAMGAFNDWVRGSYLEPLAHRGVGQIGHNLLEGACRFLRAQQMRAAGVPVSASDYHFTPRRIEYRSSDGVSTHAQ